MNRVVVMVLLLLLAGPALGTEQPPAPTPHKPPAPAEKPPAKVTPKEQKPLPWPRPYTPTEEISADSAVPFPTDI